MKNSLTRIAGAGEASAALYEIEHCMLGWRDRQLIIDDVTVIVLDRATIEFSVEWGKLTFSWWDGERAECWRVIEYSVLPGEVRLLAVRGMGAEKSFFRLRSPEVLRDQPSTVEAGEMRGRYRALLGSLIAEAYPGARVDRSTGGRTQTPEGMSVPSPYARLVVRLRNERALVIGVQSEESKQTVDDIVAAGIVWLRGHNLRRSRTPASRLAFCLPRGRSSTALERLALIDSAKAGAAIDVFEVDETVPEIVPVRPLAQYELLNLRPRDLEWPAPAPLDTPWHEALTGPAPDLIEVRVKPFSRRVSYSINGLEFASVGGEGYAECRFGVAGATDRQYLTGRNLHRLEALIAEILDRRRAGTPDPRHPFYRLRTEAWLESMIRRDISRLDPSLDERYVYSQIPAWRGDERSVIDLLSITLDGRLAVIEIKAAEDFHLPLQGLDYWLRIEQARVAGELRRRKLFPGVEPADASPLLFLVAPALRFHRSFRLVAGCLDPDIEAFQIGINSSWRDEIRVRTRIRVNGD
ncbi:MAG: hypothetical protein AB7H86_20510 [Blastocatellales bacterium]